MIKSHSVSRRGLSERNSPRDTDACRLSGSALHPLAGRTAAGGRSWWASLSETPNIIRHTVPRDQKTNLRKLTIFTLIIDTPWSCSSSSNSSTSSKNLICSRARSFSVSMRSAVGFTCAQARSHKSLMRIKVHLLCLFDYYLSCSVSCSSMWTSCEAESARYVKLLSARNHLNESSGIRILFCYGCTSQSNTFA